MNNEETQVVQPDTNEQIELTVDEVAEAEAEVVKETATEVDYKAEFLKQKAINQRLSKKLVASPEKLKQDLPTEDKDIHSAVKKLQLAETKRQFGYEHGLSPEETDAVFKLSPNPNKEVLNDDFVKGGLAALRAKKRVAENTPSSSSRSASFKIDSKANTTEARQKALDEFVAKRFS